MRIVLILSSLVVLFVAGCRHQVKNDSENRQLEGVGQSIRVSSGDADAAEPAIASSPDGNVYVVWVDHSQDGKADVMFAQCSSRGELQGKAIRVNPQPGVATAWRGDPPTIVVAPDQTIFISWTAKVESETGHATDIYLSSSRDQGHTFSEPVRVNDDKKPAVHGMHSLAVAKDGHIYVAWLDERNIAPLPAVDTKMKQGTSGHHMESNREVFIASSADNGRTFSPNKRVAENVCPCCKTALATAPDGRVYLSWRQVLPGNFRHIAVASSTDQGRTFTEPKIVSDDQWMLAGCPVSGPSMSVLGDGSLHVLWYSAGKNGETGLYSSHSQDGGNSFGPRMLVAKGEIRGTPVLANDGKHLAAVWESSAGKISMAPLESSAARSPAFTIVAGGLPAAVETPTSLFAAYIAKVGSTQAIWITTTARDELQANVR